MDPLRLSQNRESRYLTIAGNQMFREGGGEHFSKQLEEWGVSLPRLSGGRRRTSHTLEPAGGHSASSPLHQKYSNSSLQGGGFLQGWRYHKRLWSAVHARQGKIYKISSICSNPNTHPALDNRR